MEINITIKATDPDDMVQTLDVALFKLGRRLNEIAALPVDGSIDVDHATVSRSE